MSQPLRRDGDNVPLLSFDRIDLAHPTTFHLDVRGVGIVTSRWANATVSIDGSTWRASDEEPAPRTDLSPLRDSA